MGGVIGVRDRPLENREPATLAIGDGRLAAVEALVPEAPNQLID